MAGGAVARAGPLERLRRRLSNPVCAQSLAAFRIAFGLLMLHDTVFMLRAG